jgi:hypothetical protein
MFFKVHVQIETISASPSGRPVRVASAQKAVWLPNCQGKNGESREASQSEIGGDRTTVKPHRPLETLDELVGLIAQQQEDLVSLKEHLEAARDCLWEADPLKYAVNLRLGRESADRVVDPRLKKRILAFVGSELSRLPQV